MLKNTATVIGPVEAAHHPLIAYQAAFGTDLILQVAAWLWFTWPRVREAIWRLEQPVLGIRF